MLDMFFDKNTYHLSKNKIEFELIPARLRGETASFTIKVGDEVIVEEGRRVTARHVRTLEQKNVTRLEVPKEYLIGKVLAHDVFNTETGEILAKANEILTVAVVDKLIEAGIAAGSRAVRERSGSRPVHLRHAAHRSDAHAPGSAGRDLPHDASGRAAHQGCGREPVPEPVLQSGALRPVGRRPHEVQPSRASRRDHRPGHPVRPRALREAHRRVLEEAGREARARARTSSPSSRSCATSATATARSTTSITWATAACARSAKWRRTPSASAWCASSAP